MMLFLRLGVFGPAAVGWLLVLAGCGDDGGGPRADDDDDDVMMGDDDDDGGDDDDDDDDGLDDPATAPTIEVDGAPVTGVFDGVGDRDFYAVEGREGDYLLLRAGRASEGSLGDAGLLVAEDVDDFPLLAANVERALSFARTPEQLLETPAELLLRLAADGRIIVAVAPRRADGLGADHPYQLTVETAPDEPGFARDAEAGDDGSAATDAGSVPFTAYGWLEDGFDVDVFDFTVPGEGLQRVILEAYPSGRPTARSDGTIDPANGATLDPGAIWITDATGEVTLARTFPSAQGVAGPDLPLEPGDYKLGVLHGQTVLGINDFYAIRAVASPAGDFPREADDVANDDLAGAETLILEESGVDDSRVARLLLSVGDGDVDHLAFEVAASDDPAVFCAGRSFGSGVLDLQVDLLDAEGTVLGSATEDAPSGGTGGILFSAGTQPAGTYVIRVTKAGQLDDIAGDFVRCLALGLGPDSQLLP